MSTLDISPSNDTYLDENAPTTSFSSADSLLLGIPDTNQAKNILLRFSLTSLPDGATVSAADLKLRSLTAAASPNLSAVIVLADPAQAWTNSATWNKYDGTNDWAGEGVINGSGGASDPDQSASEVAIASIPTTTGLITYDVTDLVLDSIDRLGTTKVEFLIWINDTTPTVQTTFGSQDHATAGNRPILTLTYTGGASASDSISAVAADDPAGWTNVTREERLKFKGNHTAVTLTTDESPTTVSWRFYRTFDAEPFFTIRTNSNGVIGSNIADVSYSTLTTLHVNLDRAHDWEVSYSLDGGAYSSRVAINLAPRRITGRHRDNHIVTETPSGATVRTTNPKWTEQRTSRGVRIVNNIYPSE